MPNVKEAINELIEESYLLGLSEHEIRQDFEHFVRTCFSVIHDNVKDRAAINSLTENLAREKTCILIADHPQGAGSGVSEEEAEKLATEVFAEKAARRKRLILRTIGRYDPELVRLIDEQRFQGKVEDEIRRPGFQATKRPQWDHIRALLLKVGYAATIALIVLLILGFIQKS